MVSFFYPPVTGGLPSQAHFLARSLVERGLSVEVVTARTVGAPSRETLDGVGIVRLPTLSIGGYRTRAHPWLAALSAFLWRHRDRFDVLHAYQALHPAALCVALGKALGKVVVVKVTGSGDVGNVQILRRWGGSAPVVRRLLHRADAMISLSGEITSELTDDGYDPSRIVAIPNGVALAAEDRDVGESGRPPLRVITATRLSWEKANDVLLRAWAIVSRRFPQAHLHVYGEGPDRQALGKLALELDVAGSVTWHGHVADLPRRLRDADVFVLASRFGEGMSNALLEAMAAGCACVASDIVANREVLDRDRTGLLFPNEDHAALANALGRLLDDPAARHVLAEAARHVARERYAMPKVAERYESLYRQLLARRGYPMA
jgi:glycosyltransferase involved in cell wall biosynthesis